MVASVLGLVGLALVSTAVIYAGSTLLERSSQRLAVHYGLPAVVQGAIVAAIGSSFPELSSAVLATLLHGEFSLGVGAIVGSAIFNVLAIPAISTLAADEMPTGRNVVYKEAQFYMLSVAVVLITFSLAVIYNPVGGERLMGTVTRPLALVPVALYGLYVFIQYQDTKDHEAEDAGGVDGIHREWLTLAASLAIIVVAVEGIVRAAIGFGDLFGTPSFLWGLTVIAAATSLPDAIVSVRAARDERAGTSLANVLGSNVFDLLVAVPAGILVAGATAVDFAAAVPMMGFLTFATIALFALLRTDLALSNREAYGLVSLYALFVVWMVLETLGVTGLVPGA